MKRDAEIQKYQAKDGWRWRLVAGNGRAVAESGEAYTRLRDLGRAVAMVQGLFRRPLKVVRL